MSDDSSEDLLYLIGLRDEDSGGAEDAWSDFYNRHAGFLYTVLKNQYGEEFGEHTIEDMTAETMRRAHLHAATYSPERAQGSNPERRVRTWLFGIARHKALKHRDRRAPQPLDESAAVGLRRRRGAHDGSGKKAPSRARFCSLERAQEPDRRSR